MRELTMSEVVTVAGGAGIYREGTNYQFRDMFVGAIGGALLGGPAGFAIGLISGAITGYEKPTPPIKNTLAG